MESVSSALAELRRLCSNAMDKRAAGDVAAASAPLDEAAESLCSLLGASSALAATDDARVSGRARCAQRKDSAQAALAAAARLEASLKAELDFLLPPEKGSEDVDMDSAEQQEALLQDAPEELRACVLGAQQDQYSRARARVALEALSQRRLSQRVAELAAQRAEASARLRRTLRARKAADDLWRGASPLCRHLRAAAAAASAATRRSALRSQQQPQSPAPTTPVPEAESPAALVSAGLREREKESACLPPALFVLYWGIALSSSGSSAQTSAAQQQQQAALTVRVARGGPANAAVVVAENAQSALAFSYDDRLDLVLVAERGTGAALAQLPASGTADEAHPTLVSQYRELLSAHALPQQQQQQQAPLDGGSRCWVPEGFGRPRPLLWAQWLAGLDAARGCPGSRISFRRLASVLAEQKQQQQPAAAACAVAASS